jgi:NADH-quinone oxidoreductase subunit N
MIPPALSPTDLLPLWPAIILVVGAILLLMSEVFLASTSRVHQAPLALAATAAAGGVAFTLLGEPPREVLQGFAVLDPFSSFASVVICVGLFLALLASTGFLRARDAERGEFYALMLFSAAGMSLLVLSNELITLFVNLEVLSVATYALTAYLRRGPRHAEAGFKYFILGAFSAAVLLYGTSLLYGAAGTTRLPALAVRLGPALSQAPSLVYAGAALIAAGLAFKVAAVPFHMWTPDVYEGAPTPVTALMSAGVKAAAFGALVRVMLAVARPLSPTFAVALLATLALLTMVGGNLLALPQRNVKRMLAYSSIAHAGYVLLGVASLFARPEVSLSFSLVSVTPLVSGPGLAPPPPSDALRGILFYLLAYTVTAVGAFSLLGALERREDEERGTAWDLERFAGLAQRRPWWAFAMAAFMLSLAGIPPTAGFFGKLLLFRSAVDSGLVSLAVVGVLASAAGAYYYLRVVVYMFMRPAPEGAAPERHWGTELAVALSVAAVVALGVIPGSIGTWLSQAGTLFGNR